MLQSVFFNNKWKSLQNVFFVVVLMALFFSLFDGTFSYMVPIVLDKSGLSKTLIGLIIASSSAFGAIFDYIISIKFPSIHFRKIYFYMFIGCLFAPMVLWKGNMIAWYIVAMATWGMYYDLFSIGNADFLSRKTEKKDHARKLGQLWVFRSLGYTIAPIALSVLAIEGNSAEPYLLMWLYTIIGILFFVLLLYLCKQNKKEFLPADAPKLRLRLSELSIWKRIGKIVYPVLILLIFCEVVDAFFWMIGPLIAEELQHQHIMGGLFLTFYSLPPLISGWIVGDITKRYGKKKTGIIAALLASIIFISFYFIQNPLVLFGFVFLGSFLFSFTLPSVYSAILDYIEETPLYEKEIATIQDFSVNIGYIVGPVAAGLAADMLGNRQAFTALGIGGFFLTLLLLKITPKHVRVIVKK